MPLEEMWTPWRMPYILENKEDRGCLFCERPRDSGDEGLILHRGPLTFTIMNLFPYAVGHLMVIPYRHVARWSALTADERNEIARRLRQAEGILRNAAGARWFHAGINLGRAAGAGVAGHLHVHLVPRGTSASWSNGAGDETTPPAPVRATYERLKGSFARLT